MAHLLKCLIPTIGSPARLNGKEGRYALAAFYGELLEMEIANEGWLLIAARGEPDRKFHLALDGDGWDDRRPPRWPDPEYPQQMHLDVLVPDPDAAAARVTGLGGTLLRDSGSFRVYADPAGHPLCLYPEPAAPKPRVGRIVFDCFSPRATAAFYEGFLGSRGRVEDTPQRVVVDLGDPKLPDLAFQHAQFRAARWPDPEYPAQLHVDYRWHDGLTARAALVRAERLGAVRLPQPPDNQVYADPASHPFCIQNEIPAVVDLVGLYVDPPEYAVAYCVEENGAIRAATTMSPVDSSPVDSSPVDPPAGGDDLAALLGSVTGSPPGSPDRVTAFVAYLDAVDAAVPAGLEVDLVCDWDATYENPAVRDWLADRSRVQVHRNPPDAAWTGQVERWLTACTDGVAAGIRSWARRADRAPFTWVKGTGQIRESLDRQAGSRLTSDS